MKVKKALYLTHRWIGIGMCLLMAMWFFSGVVMMYVGFPSLSTQERLDGLPALSAENILVSPERLVGEVESNLSSLRLTSIAGRPAYIATSLDGSSKIQFADTGEYLTDINERQALHAAEVFKKHSGIESSYALSSAGLIDMDQWSVSSGLNRHRPLYKVSFYDAAGTNLYISSVTGEVVRDTNRTERIWNWLGANLHWIYPYQLRRHDTVWRWLLIILPLIGLASIVTGTIVGVMRLRLKKRYRGTDVTPYRGLMKWHHLLGLGAVVFLTTYMFSGLMSMNPWSVFTSSQSYSELETRIRGEFPSENILENLSELRDYLRENPGQKEVRWQWLNGHFYQVVVKSSEGYQSLPSVYWQDSTALLDDLKRNTVSAIQSYDQDASLAGQEILDDFDLYYYSHHDSLRPLPVLKLRFDNDDSSWVYIDVKSGEILAHKTRLKRVQRWLYNGLHSLDFNFLIGHRPAWDLVVIALCIFGFALAYTSVVIGWRRVAR